MARYKNGINGPVSGKVGSVVAVNWRGIDCLRSLPDVSGRQATEAQRRHWKVFGMVSSWLKPLKELIGVGFQFAKEGKTPMNEAISFVFREALLDDGLEKGIDFPKVVFSRGELLMSIVMEVVTLPGMLHIKWRDAPAAAFNKATDLANFVFYNPSKEKFAIFSGAAMRGDQEAVLKLPADFEGDALHGYMHYVNAGGDAVSTTLYLPFKME